MTLSLLSMSQVVLRKRYRCAETSVKPGLPPNCNRQAAAHSVTEAKPLGRRAEVTTREPGDPPGQNNVHGRVSLDKASTWLRKRDP